MSCSVSEVRAHRGALTRNAGPGSLPKYRPGYWGFRMFDVRDLFQWERFITPSIVRTFYGAMVILIVLMGLGGAVSGLSLMVVSVGSGAVMIVVSLLGAFAAILGVRIASEFVLVMFRMNEHLGALRSRAEM
jgi:hypothetical protein